MLQFKLMQSILHNPNENNPRGRNMMSYSLGCNITLKAEMQQLFNEEAVL